VKAAVFAIGLVLAVCSAAQGGQNPRPSDHQDHSAHKTDATPSEPPQPRLPVITDADRAAAFPEVHGHSVHDRVIGYYVLFDQLEWQTGNAPSGMNWDNTGWIGGDLDRFWFRTEGESHRGRLDTAQAHLLYGRAVARWWDLVAGVRQDIRPGSAQTWAAIGIQGLAPYWFEVEATAYLGAAGRTHFRLETEYEVLLTNRLILQPHVEANIHGKADPERGIGAGLNQIDVGFRLRYEYRRERAPYIGVVWSRRFFGAADLAEAAGDGTGGTRLVFGLRLWF
jgi:copper resistance protein B